LKTKLIAIAVGLVIGIFVVSFGLFLLIGFPLLLAFIAATALAVKAAFCVSYELASGEPA